MALSVVDSPSKKNKYEAIKKLKEVQRQISQQPYVKRDPQYERRRKFFSAYLKGENANDMMVSLMKEIGFFQQQENNLDHIPGLAKVKQERQQFRLKKERKNEELKMDELQLPMVQKILSVNYPHKAQLEAEAN